MTRAVILASVAALLAMRMAAAHPWMQPGASSCCGSNDCKPYPREAIERIAEGWRIRSTGQVFRDGEPGIFPLLDTDGHATGDEVWICIPSWSAPTAKCIFILPEGS